MQAVGQYERSYSSEQQQQQQLQEHQHQLFLVGVPLTSPPPHDHHIFHKHHHPHHPHVQQPTHRQTQNHLQQQLQYHYSQHTNAHKHLQRQLHSSSQPPPPPPHPAQQLQRQRSGAQLQQLPCVAPQNSRQHQQQNIKQGRFPSVVEEIGSDSHQQEVTSSPSIGSPHDHAAAAAPLHNRIGLQQQSGLQLQGGEFTGHEENFEETARGKESAGGGSGWFEQYTLPLNNIQSDMVDCISVSFRGCSASKGPVPLEEEAFRSKLENQRAALRKSKEKLEYNTPRSYKSTEDISSGKQKGLNHDGRSRCYEKLHSFHWVGDDHGETDAAYAGAAENNVVYNKYSDRDGGTGQVVNFGKSIDENETQPQQVNENQKLVIENDDVISPDRIQDESGIAITTDDSTRIKKRKKRSLPYKKMIFFEKLVQKILDKQESMNRALLEEILRRDAERKEREEAWRRQEAASFNRQFELRAHAISVAYSRDDSLLDFLKKATGQNLDLPKLARQPSSALPAAITKPSELIINGDILPLTKKAHVQLVHHPDPHIMKSKRWPKQEVQALIRLRSSMELKFQETGPKGELWETLSKEMACMGYNRNAKRCKEKWENINKYYRKAKEINRNILKNGKCCPYFQQLDTLYSYGVLQGSVTRKTRKAAREDRQQMLDKPTDQRPHSAYMAQGGPGDIHLHELAEVQTSPCENIHELLAVKGSRQCPSMHKESEDVATQVDNEATGSKRTENYQSNSAGS